MLREVLEETGYTVETDSMLGVHSRWMAPGERLDGNPREYHACRVLYTAHVVGGDLAVEEYGSSDDTKWFPLVELDELDRLDLVDQALRLAGLGTWVDRPEEQPSPVAEQDVEQ